RRRPRAARCRRWPARSKWRTCRRRTRTCETSWNGKALGASVASIPRLTTASECTAAVRVWRDRLRRVAATIDAGTGGCMDKASLRRPWHVLARWLLPLRCLLCGAPGEHGVDVCAACATELPRNLSSCARCALPLPVPAALCGECQRHAPPWDAAWAPFRYGWPLDRLESRFKFGRDLAAGRVLSSLWRCEPCPVALPSLLLAVPLHRSRLRQRGYNQALELARPLARALGLPLRHDMLQRQRRTEAQTERDAAGR